jgi:type VI secretion system protein VasI
MRRSAVVSVRVVLSLAVVLVAGDVEAQQAATVQSRLAACVAKVVDAERLACFDAVAKTLAPAMPLSSAGDSLVTAGSWEVIVTENPLDDTRIVLLWLLASSGESSTGKVPQFGIRCQAGRVSAYAAWRDYLGSATTTVTVRVGSGAPTQQRWSNSTDKTATFAPNAAAFVRSLREVDRLVLQVTPYNESPVTAVFDVAGLAESMKAFDPRCQV